MAVRIQIRRDNSTNWSSANPVLALGELGYDTTNEKLKIGDGVTAWNSLLYIASTDWDDLLNTPTTLSGYGITDAVTKNYVDNLVQGLRALPSGEAFSDSNLDATYDNGDDGVGATLTANSNGAFPTIDDVTLSQFDGVVVNGQTNAAHNGSYRLTTVGDVGTPWVLTRCGFCDEADEQAGSFEFVTGGTTYGNTGWLLTVASTPVVMGTTELNWVQFSGAGAYTAGDGLELAGTVFSVNVDDSTIEINSDTVRVKDSGITNAKLANPTITVTGDTGTSAIDLGDTLTISGTDPIDTTVSGDSLTLSIDDATTSSKGAASFNSANFTVSSGAVSSKDITLGSSTLTLGSTTTAIAGLTQLTIDNIDINGNTIISTNTDGDINLIPNANGNVGIGTATPSTKLDVNGNITATRLIGSADTLTTARNIALTGAVTGNADFDGSGNISISTTATSDPTLTLNGDVSGSATFTNLGNATLTVTVADDSHNHIIGNVDGLQTALDGKAATTTTISAGGGLTGGGSLASNRTISHSDTSSQSSVNNSNGTVIQDVTLDTYGHVTALGSVNLDGRYYTESEIDTKLTNGTVTTIANQWSNVAGNMTGFVNDGGGNLGIRFNATPGGTNTLVENGVAYQMRVDNDSTSGTLFFQRGTTSGGLAGETINWSTALNIGADASNVTVYGNRVLTTADEGSGNGLDADTLDGQEGSYYTNFNNFTNIPDPTLTLNGDVSGSATFTNLGNATLTVTVANDSHTHDTRYLQLTGGTLTGDLEITDNFPVLNLRDSDDSYVGQMFYNNGRLFIRAQDNDGTNDGNILLQGLTGSDANTIQLKATTTNVTNNLDVGGNLDVTNNIETTSNVLSNLVRANSGSDGTPSYSFQGDVDTGMFNPTGGELAFSCNSNEIMRIFSNGHVGINTTTPQDAPGSGQVFTIKSKENTGTSRGLAVVGDGGVGDYPIQVTLSNATTQKFVVYGDGDVENSNNNYGSLSDIRYKQDIVDANSQWDDVKAVQLKNYRLKDEVERYGDEAITQLGVIAQDLLDSGMSGLVDYNEDQDRYSVKYSVLCLKALGALQQAMEKIEILEAKVAALEQK